jgi:hypothetical protein
MTQKELNDIIEQHQHWLNKDCDGWELMRASLRGDLSNVTLTGADLRKACMIGANLEGVDLDGADLRLAHLRNANLAGANLFEANLTGANLSDAYLAGAYLNEASFYEANLRGANLSNAGLTGADLSRADLDGADLRGAILGKTTFSGANLNGAKFDDSEKCRLGMVLKEPMKGYKKTFEGNVIELEIPEGATVFSINKDKCRTNKAIVKKCKGIQHSILFYSFEYRKGDVLEIKNFNTKYNVECGEGIHFFRTKEEAERYDI